MSTVLAIDIGGTKMAAASVDSDGEILVRDQTSTPREGTAEDWFACLVALLSEVRLPSNVACGVGCGGPMARGGEWISPLNISQVRGFPLQRQLVEVLKLPVVIDNDAKVLALAEGWKGAAAGHQNYLAMVVSTGVGGGIVLDGRLLDGASSNAGHIGHVQVDPNGPLCRCGAYGCLEAMASGTAIAQAIGQPAEFATESVRRQCGMLVGRAVGSVANLLDLPLALVAGSVALGYGESFFAAAQAEIDQRCRLTFSEGTRIQPAGLGADGPLLGAAAIGWRHHNAGSLP